MNPLKTVSIIGFGAVGSALTNFFKSSDYTLISVWDRKTEVCRINIDDKLVAAKKNSPESINELGETIFICTPDDQIVYVVDKLSALTDDWTGFNFVHTSGSLSANIFSDLRSSGAKTASMHPIQTFTRKNGSERLKNIWYSLQGDAELLSKLETLISDLESESLRFNESQKETMHVAAVFASNYLVTLMNVVEDVAGKNDINNSIEILKPIIHQTVQNILETGTTESLTGPVVRGDIETVKRHLTLLDQNREAANLYKQLGLRSVLIAEESGKLQPDKAVKLRELFKQ